MSKLLKTTALLMLCSTAGCYSKYIVLQADVVSMTKANSGTTKELKVGSSIEEKWCTGDDLALTSQGNSVGLADQVIYKAQDGGKRADFITDVTIYRDTKGCALLSGKAAKM